MPDPLEILLGFKNYKAGRVHLLCAQCGRKMSNMARGEYDPPNAVLLVIPCPKCSQGCKIEGGDYFDANGHEIDWHESWMKGK